MNINDLPPEILIEIFSYLSQRDLFLFHGTICELWTQLVLLSEFWKNVEFKTVYCANSQSIEHFYRIQHYVHKLIIDEEELNEIFRHEEKEILLLNLKTLDISVIESTQLTNDIVEKCPHLRGIKFSTDVQTDIHHCFQAFSKLQLVSFDILFYNFGVQGDLCTDLINFVLSQSYLKKLALRASPYLIHDMDNIITEILNKSSTLKSLYISNDCVSSKAFTDIKNPLSLEELTIHSERITDEGLEYITKRSKQLKSLNIKQCKAITDTGISYIANNCQYLEKLLIGSTFPRQYTEASGTGLFALSQGCPKLTYFSATGCTKINDHGVMSVAISCKNLKYVILKGCQDITDVSVNAIATNCSLLYKTDLSGCVNISLNGIIRLITSCKKLEILILSYCYCIVDNTEQTPDTLSKGSPNAIQDRGYHKSKKKRQLKSQNCDNFEHICSLDMSSNENMSRVKELNLKGSKNLSKITILTLAKYCPDLSRLILPNNAKMVNDENFIRSLFDMCVCLNKFSIFRKTIHRPP